MRTKPQVSSARGATKEVLTEYFFQFGSSTDNSNMISYHFEFTCEFTFGCYNITHDKLVVYNVNGDYDTHELLDFIRLGSKHWSDLCKVELSTAFSPDLVDTTK
ncbi:hypothetical protein PPL_04181 [Heterostelium album PN500]|uniref:Uncharacterized protein n=1 Tax=Heterostelium pallidum (strain ATCC 26659 / Pp 5 / PN500) TaxID=670386 RepID=D3B690_HETP5|nr:hypothetical protein PPL_04181 [Heterostelium album PN500]EFA83388.1 hypothetical protein PPL_04181 [Heterostelium album PN500]|eukprot:XP_020435505.1 hypothetical protein PPL_04181 [Heterostelium album PN500]